MIDVEQLSEELKDLVTNAREERALQQAEIAEVYVVPQSYQLLRLEDLDAFKELRQHDPGLAACFRWFVGSIVAPPEVDYEGTSGGSANPYGRALYWAESLWHWSWLGGRGSWKPPAPLPTRADLLVKAITALLGIINGDKVSSAKEARAAAEGLEKKLETLKGQVEGGPPPKFFDDSADAEGDDCCAKLVAELGVLREELRDAVAGRRAGKRAGKRA